MPKYNFAKKKILILGAARSGKAAALLLKQTGADILVSDSNSNESLKQAAKELTDNGIPVILGGDQLPQLEGKDIVVPSPGISPDTPVLAVARSQGKQIISEVEVAWRLSDVPLIGVTGTNGKTTTTALIGEILRVAGMRTVVAGNIGFPLSEAALRHSDSDYFVVEISSFQLHFTEFFYPNIAVLLNITPDHFDWHQDFNSYAAAKYKIFANQQSKDWAVINAAETAVSLHEIKAKKLFFSLSQQANGSYCLNGQIVTGNRNLGKPEEIYLKGEHNLENCLAAAVVAQILDIDIGLIMDVFRRFKGVEHRLEFVLERHGVQFYNDSKATNPEAAIKGIRAFNQPVVLLAGGRNKGNSFESLAKESRGRIKTALLYGEAAADMAAAFKAAGIDFKITNSLDEAVGAAQKITVAGDVVLLSPACASYDMFQDFEERGRTFKEAVASLRAML